MCSINSDLFTKSLFKKYEISALTYVVIWNEGATQHCPKPPVCGKVTADFDLIQSV